MRWRPCVPGGRVNPSAGRSRRWPGTSPSSPGSSCCATSARSGSWRSPWRCGSSERPPGFSAPPSIRPARPARACCARSGSRTARSCRNSPRASRSRIARAGRSTGSGSGRLSSRSSPSTSVAWDSTAPRSASSPRVSPSWVISSSRSSRVWASSCRCTWRCAWRCGRSCAAGGAGAWPSPRRSGAAFRRAASCDRCSRASCGARSA